MRTRFSRQVRRKLLRVFLLPVIGIALLGSGLAWLLASALPATVVALYLGGAVILMGVIVGQSLRLVASDRLLDAERRLGDRTRTFQTLFNITRGGLALLDSSGRFLDVNPSLMPLFGYQRTEVLGMNIDDLNLAPQSVLSGALGLVDVHGSGVIEASCQRKNGSVVQVEMTSALLPSSGGQLFVIFRDITERKHAEQIRTHHDAELRQSQKLEAIGTLASGIAHDFNNILSAIVGNNELALQDIDSDNPALTSLQEIRKAAQRAKELVRRMTVFARPQDNEVRPLQLTPVVADAMKLVRASLPAAVEIICRYAAEVPRVMIDDSQISQVLLNLCTNAYQAMDQYQGRIEVSVDACQVTAEQALLHADLQAGQYVCLGVRDNGRGIDQAIVERIFEPFFTTKSAGEGTGLGLSIVHSIVRGHGGAILLESMPGAGTAFYVYFPVAVVAESAVSDSVVPAAPRELQQGTRQHILYVDDEEPLVFLTTRLLERLGYRVSGYTNAKAALRDFLAHRTEYDLLITDQSMPGMSGTHLAREILSLHPDTQIMLVSGYLRPYEIEQARAIGIKEIITKPNSVDELAAAVHRLLSSQSVSIGIRA